MEAQPLLLGLALLLPLLLVLLTVYAPRAGFGLPARATTSFFAYLPLLAVALPALAILALAVRRWPAGSLMLVIVTSAFEGFVRARWGVDIPVRRVAYVVFAGIFVWLAWTYLFGGRRENRAVAWPGIVALAAYLVFTALEIPFSESFSIGTRAYLAGPVYIVYFLIVAYAPWSGRSRQRVLAGLVVVALLVGVYAVYQLMVGPSDSERALASATPFNFVDGRLPVFGSFVGRAQLAGWTAIAIPLLFAVTLLGRGAVRAGAAVAMTLSTVGLVASEVRTGVIGALIGVCIVFLLQTLARSTRELRVKTVVLGAGALVVVALGAFALGIGGSQSASQRYENILHPGQDPAFQARIFRWKNALDQIDQRPLGYGLGTAGVTQRERGRFVRLDNFFLDNAFLEVAYQQGMIVLVFFVAAVVLVLYSLARSAVLVLDRYKAMMAIGASGTLAAWLTLLMGRGYREDASALVAWLIVGLAASYFVVRRPRDDVPTGA